MQHPPLQIVVLCGDEHGFERYLGCLDEAEHQKFEVEWCQDCDEVLTRIAEDPPDLILLDYDNNTDKVNELMTSSFYQSSQSAVIGVTRRGRPAIREALRAGVTECLEDSGLTGKLLEGAIDYALDRQKAKTTLGNSGYQDPLTGVANRGLFLDRLGHALENAKRHEQRLAVMMVNLDDFKRINQTYGLKCGDYVLGMIAERLAGCMRKTDSVARIAGDEFVLILEDVGKSNDIAIVAKKVIDILAAPLPIEDQHIVLGCSVGIAVTPDAGEDVEALIEHADAAMLEAKTLRGSHYRFYTEEMNAAALTQMNLEADLRRALRRNEFELFYQPRVDLKNGDVAGVEALIRWRHPTQGLLSPIEFIPLAEEVGLIVPMGYWVIQQACDDLNYLAELGYEIDFAINISFKQIHDPKFVETVTRIIRNSGVDPARLEFELTETAVMLDVEHTQKSMTELNQLGVCFSLDDFGTGYSSFAHIQRLPIDALKIDKSFVGNVSECEDDAIIVKAMINLAHSLQLDVVAEGAETLEQVQFLWENNCSQVQGYYFSPPVALADFCSVVIKDNHQQAC